MNLLKKKFITHVLALGFIVAITNCNLFALQENNSVCVAQDHTKHITIVGGGIIAALQSYFVHREAVKKGINLRITICEKNSLLDQTPGMGGVPSLTPDEICAVVPPIDQLVPAMKTLFSLPGGIRIDDVPAITTSPVTDRFLAELNVSSTQTDLNNERKKILLDLGRMSMDLWQSFYDTADQELREILGISNFNPCREIAQEGAQAFHNGYRIDLIYNVPNAINKALAMKKDYESLGYTKCEVLAPEKVELLDPSLASFCKKHSTVVNEQGLREWNSDTVALLRPGGCIDGKTFMPKFYDYLKKSMGTYVDQAGNTQDAFTIHFGKEVKALQFESTNSDVAKITGLYVNNGELISDPNATYVLCPGEAVGTLYKFALKEPAYARFAGASLKLEIPLSEDKIKEFEAFNHYMEVHQVGVVLTWQARFAEGKMRLGVAGTKAYYADQEPNTEQAFAKNRNLLQLNMMNDVLPQFLSIALGRDTTGQELTQQDLDFLENAGIAKRWVGTRAVAFDGFPTCDSLYTADGAKVSNGITLTHFGSGGVSFGTGAAFIGTQLLLGDAQVDPLITKVLNFAQSNRSAQA